MPLRVWRFATLVLAALSLMMESAHVLELPQKLRYDATTYTLVNGTLYRYFASVGAVYQLGAIVLAAVLAVLVRGRGPTFRWTVAGALRTDPSAVPGLWMRLRGRWEYGHAAGFVVQLAGFAALVASVLVETPARVRPDAGTAAAC